MHKLVILIEPLEDRTAFDESWPEFLHLAEAMPGLLRETSSQVSLSLSGKHYAVMHEFFFASLLDAQVAMASENGRAAGRLIQKITAGKLVLFIADHQEDELANIRQYQSASPHHPQNVSGSASESDNN
jgi:hypothetical protein